MKIQSWRGAVLLGRWPEGGIYVILDRTWGGWGAARGTVEREQVSSSF